MLRCLSCWWSDRGSTDPAHRLWGKEASFIMTSGRLLEPYTSKRLEMEIAISKSLRDQDTKFR